MGANWGYTLAMGTSSKDAFDFATRNAISEYGSNAYNGPISTFSGFKEVPSPKGKTPQELYDMIDDYEYMEKTYSTLGGKWSTCGCFKVDLNDKTKGCDDINQYVFWGWFAT